MNQEKRDLTEEIRAAEKSKGLKEDQLVYFNVGQNEGYGRVRGISTLPIAIIGRSIIVEPLSKIPGYDFSCIVVFENQLRFIE